MDKSKKILSKKVMAVTLAGVTLAVTIPATPLKTALKSFVVVSAEENATSEGSFKYSQNTNGTVEITQYIGTDSTVVIPSAIGGKKVSGIGVSAFNGNETVESVTIPDGVTYIDNRAFYECISLKKIVIPDSVTRIGESALKNCTALTSISIGSGLTWIGSSAFESCIGVKTITLPDGVTYIGEKGFYNCQSLLHFGIPDSVQFIGADAFKTTASNDVGIPWYSTIPKGEVYFGNVFYSYKGDMPENTTITIKDGTTSIADSAFLSYKNLVKIEMPDTVTYLGADAFRGCIGLKEVELSKNIVEIGKEAFYGCTGLGDVILPDNLAVIHEYAFRKCTGIKNIQIPKGTHYISKTAFLECTNLKYMVFSENSPFDMLTGENFFDNNNLGLATISESSIKNVIITKSDNGSGMTTNLFGTIFKGNYLIEEGIEIPSELDNPYVVFTLNEENSEFKIVERSESGIDNLPTKVIIKGKEYTVTEDKEIKPLVAYIEGTPATCTSEGRRTIWWDGENAVFYYDETGESVIPNVMKYYNSKDIIIPKLDHHYVDGKCDMCGKELDTVTYEGNSITLDGDIVVNYYMQLDESVLEDEGAVMRFTTEKGSITEVSVNDAEVNTTTVAGKTCYIFSCDMPAKEMNDTIEAQIVFSNGSTSETYSYTIKQYADAIIENADNNAEYAKAKEVVKAMLVYGSYAQIYFGHNTDKLAFEISGSAEEQEVEAVSAEDLKQYAESTLTVENTDNVTLTGANMSLLSKTTLRLFFKVKDDSNLKFLYGSDELKVYKSSDYSYIEIPGIRADNLNKTISITVVDGTVSKTVQYNPMTYVYNALNRAETETRTPELKRLMKALYLFNVKAIDYKK